MALIDHDFDEYLYLQKLNMSNWRIVDVDHFMKGNSFFNKLVTENEWHEAVMEKIGPQDKRSIVVKEPEQMKSMKEMIDTY